MATSLVDALVVTLGLNLTAFKRGKSEASSATKKLTEEEKRAAKEIEDRNKRAAESFRSVRNEVLALVAVFTTGMGIKSFVESTVMSTAALGRMSQNLGMSAKDLAEWQLAAKNAGGSAQGITQALQQSQQAVAKAHIGLIGDDVQAFLKWGGDFNRDLKDGNTYLLARARIIQREFQKDPGRARLVAQQMGIDDDSFNLLKQGPEAIQRLREQQRALAEEQARASAPAEALRKRFDTLENSFQSVGVRVVTDLMPTFDRLVVLLQRLADWVSAHKSDISAWVDHAVTSVQQFVQWADKAAESVGGWKNVLAALVALKVLSAVTPLLSLASALGGVGGGLARIATSGPGALAILGLLAEQMRKQAFDKAIPPGPDHDQHVAEAQAGGAVRPDTGSASPGAWGDWGNAVKSMFTPGAKRPPRGIRNNNPGNIRYGDFARKMGATGRDDGGFAVFPTMQAGMSAEQALLQRYAERGDNTIRKIISKYAPASENDTNGYIAQVSKKLGVGADQQLSSSQLSAVASAIYAQENGARYANPLAMNPRSIGQANAAQIAQQSAAAGAPSTGAPSVTSTSSSQTHVENVTIQTQATDASGIARDFQKAMSKYNFTVAQANTGLT